MLGCDIIELDRIKKSYRVYGIKFLDRILAPAEKDIFYRRGESIAFLGGRFAAKEAVAKAFKSGIGEKLSFTDIEIVPDENGAPQVYLAGVSRPDIEVSISHSRDYALAVCLDKNKDGWM